MLLGLPQLGDDLGSTAFRPFFLGDGVIGARKGRLMAISTRLAAIAPNLTFCQSGLTNHDCFYFIFYLSTMAGITGSLGYVRHFLIPVTQIQ